MRPLTHDGDGPEIGPSPSALTEYFLVSDSNIDAERKEGSDAHSPPFSRRWPLHERHANKIPRSTPRTADTSPAPTIPSPVSMGSLTLDEESLNDVPSRLRLESAAVSVSTTSSISSRRHSITASSYEGDDLAASLGSLGPPTHATMRQNPLDSLESQLIMPCVAVSAPPAFTDFGKAIGKLRVMVAGRPGIGRTSLIRSIMRTCAHLTNVGSSTSSQCDCEVFASTRPHVHCQSSSSEKSIVSQRSHSTERILDRNICFIDLPSASSSQCQHSSSTFGYLRSQAAVLLQKQLDDNDLWSLLNSGAYPVVDVCLYMLPHTGPWSNDLEAIRRIQQLTNVIPVIARTEQLSTYDIELVKTEIAGQLHLADIKIVSFLKETGNPDIFAVSSAADYDLDTMDASELMDSAYEPPLVGSDLQDLVDRILSPDGSAWLRNAVALKLLWWRRRNVEHYLLSQLTPDQLRPGWRTHPFSWVQCDDGLDEARWWQHVDLNDWARCLRRSIAAEGGSFTPLNGQELEVVQRRGFMTRERRRSRGFHAGNKVAASQIQDPLGLLSIASRLRQERRRAIELISGLGIAAFATACLVNV